MSIFFILLILVWSQISGYYAIALFIVDDNENKLTMNNESCISCICKPITKNCNEEICTDPKSINLCKNKTYEANTEFSAPNTAFSLSNIGFIIKMFICMFVMYMFIMHASGNCFESRSTRRIRPSLNQILSDDGLPSTDSDDRSCIMPLSVHSGQDNDINDPPPSYDDTQMNRTHIASPRCTTQRPVHRSDLNQLNTFNDHDDSAHLFLASSVDEPPPSYDEFLATNRSKPSRVHNYLLPDLENDHILYMTIPVNAIESVRDSQTPFVSEIEMLCTQV